MSSKIEIGTCVFNRRRSWLVEAESSPNGLPAILSLTCLDDDATGYQQQIIPECELDFRNLDQEMWELLGANNPPEPADYAAYLQSIQWNTSTAADTQLFQAPFRAGIEISPYQLVPLAKALDLPRVNILIADDVGLGKTIEAGLILRELLLRKRVDFFVVAAPASMTLQWKEELESKFGLSATIFDANFVAQTRARRGFGYNPWQSTNAFIISHTRLSDEAYSVGLKALLGDFRARSMLILDEAHHAAPAHSLTYAIDSKMTNTIRELGKLFEHRVFMSATPHNGHSNSFAALLEMLDPQRFTRGIEVRAGEADAVMVRRLKSDLRELTDTPFPERNVENIEIGETASDAPEILLFDDLLDLGDKASGVGGFTYALLQQRLLSSVAAFCSTFSGELHKLKGTEVAPLGENLLQRAQKYANSSDAKSRKLSSWIVEHMGFGSDWNKKKLIIFSQFEDTIEWLRKQLLQDLKISQEDGILDLYTGNTPADERERLKSKFNSEASHDSPLRILLCTDAAREGINLQHQCADLFHFDLPWNPARLEQRNGRIDRRLQPRSKVNCYYFTYQNRPADRILHALVKKTERINRELGEVGPVIEQAIHKRLSNGFFRSEIGKHASDLESPEYLELQRRRDELKLSPGKERRLKTLKEELNSVEKRLQSSAERKGISDVALENVFLSALNRLGAAIPSTATRKIGGVDTFRLPVDADGFQSSDWTPVFDALRVRPPNKGETTAQYRETAPLKRVSFKTVVENGRHRTDIEHLHLEHRLIRRLLSQFQSLGFRSRLERTAVLRSNEKRERVLLLTRLNLYAKGANRLHSELIPVAAAVNPQSVTALKPDGKTAASVILELQNAIQESSQADPELIKKFTARATADALTLRPIAEKIAQEKELALRKQLGEVGDKQAASMEKLLNAQRERIAAQLNEDDTGKQGEFQFEEERLQYELDRKNWERRLSELDAEIEREPQRVKQAHEVTATRLEPIGLVYLLPRDTT